MFVFEKLHLYGTQDWLVCKYSFETTCIESRTFTICPFWSKISKYLNNKHINSNLFPRTFGHTQFWYHGKQLIKNKSLSMFTKHIPFLFFSCLVFIRCCFLNYRRRLMSFNKLLVNEDVELPFDAQEQSWIKFFFCCWWIRKSSDRNHSCIFNFCFTFPDVFLQKKISLSEFKGAEATWKFH